MMWIFILILVAAAAYLWYGSKNRATPPGTGTESGDNTSPGTRPAEEGPLAEAERRYARGEITREEYEQIKKDLGGT